MEKKSENTFEVVFCIVNTGFSEKAMEVARGVGATGGTVLKANGTTNLNAEKIFGVTVSPEKEIVMIVIGKDYKNALLHALYSAVGLNTDGGGIAFSMPVSNAVGISQIKEVQEDNKTEK